MSELDRREEFVKAAMQALIRTSTLRSHVISEDWETIATMARKMADIQLKELRENPSDYQPPSCHTGPG